MILDSTSLASCSRRTWVGVALAACDVRRWACAKACRRQFPSAGTSCAFNPSCSMLIVSIPPSWVGRGPTSSPSPSLHNSPMSKSPTSPPPSILRRRALCACSRIDLNHECGIIRSRHREQSNFIDWVCSRWSEHIRWQSIEGTRSRKERDLAHHAGTRSRKAFPCVLDPVPSEIAFLTYICM